MFDALVFYAFVFFTGVLSIFTLLPLSKMQVWWIRGFDFPRMQFFIFAATLLILEILLLSVSAMSSWIFFGITSFYLIFHAWWIAPFTPLFPVEVNSIKSFKDENVIGIMTANVLMTNKNSEKFIALVKKNKPDILVTLESDEWWESQLSELENEYSYTIKCPLDNLYGMHVYSKLPLSESKIEFLVEDDVPSMHTLVTLPSGRKVRAHFLHPAPPSPTENEESAERDAELIVVAKSVANSKVPIIVTGDLNDVAWSANTRLFRKISGLLDPRVGRGMYNTFHAGYWFMRWPLDHLFHSTHFSLLEIKRLPYFGSDHFAFFSRLHHDGEPHPSRRELRPDKEDKQEADEKLNGHHVSVSDVPRPGCKRVDLI